MDYRLCRQTVTLYRRTDAGVLRQVLRGCYLQRTCAVSYDTVGRQLRKPFLLVIPGTCPVQVDDRVCEGIGPEVTDWQQLLTDHPQKLLQVQYVTAYGCHTEAGCKYSLYDA